MPYNSWFAFRGANGIPRNAIICTAIIAFAALMLRDLNTIAPLITMFFLITYATINIVILVEQKLNLVSFRPLLKIPIFVPLIGATGTLFTMFVINPAFSLIAIIMIMLLYNLLMSRHIHSTEPEGDVRSSLFVSLAEWAAKRSMTLPRSHGRAWRPNILIPADNPQEIRGVSEFLRDITFPNGSVSILGIKLKDNEQWLESALIPLVDDFRHEGIYSTWTMVTSDTFHESVLMSVQAMKSGFFGPNTLFLRRPLTKEQRQEIISILSDTSSEGLGVILYISHPRSGLGRRRIIQLFIQDEFTKWRTGLKGVDFDLALLIAYKLMSNWEAELHLIVQIQDKSDEIATLSSVRELLEYARISVSHISAITGSYETYFQHSTEADLNIFSFTGPIDFSQVESIVRASKSTCLFCRDSSEENIFA